MRISMGICSKYISHVWLVCGLLSMAESAMAISQCWFNNDFDYYYPACIREAVGKYPEDFSHAFALLKAANEKRAVVACPSSNGKFDRSIQGLSQFASGDMARIYQALGEESLSKLKKPEITKTLDDCMERERRYHELALQASNKVYDLETIEGYEKADELNLPDTGLKAYLLKPKNPNEPAIIAFAGTEDDKDKTSYHKWGLPQIVEAQPKFDEWVRDLYANTTNRGVIVTGHSLGGGLAQAAVGMMRDYSGDNVRLVTFNAFKGMELFDKYAERQGLDTPRKLAQNLDSLEEGVHYRHEGDIVSKFGHSTGGQQRTLNSDIPRSTAKTIEDKIRKPHEIQTLLDATAATPNGLADTCPTKNSKGWETFSGVLASVSSWTDDFFTPKNSRETEDVIYFRTKHPHQSLHYKEYIGLSEGQIRTKCAYDSDACGFSAAEFIKNKDYISAKVKLKAACANYHQEDCLELFKLLLQLGATDEAKKEMQKACAAKVPETCRQLGDLLRQLGDSKGADVKYASACSQGDDQGCRENLTYAGAAKHFAKRCESVEFSTITGGDVTTDPCYLAAKTLKTVKNSPLPLLKKNNNLKAEYLKKSCQSGNHLSCMEHISLIAADDDYLGKAIEKGDQNRASVIEVGKVIRTLDQLDPDSSALTRGLLFERFGVEEKNQEFIKRAEKYYSAACPAKKQACLRLDAIAQQRGQKPKFTKEICDDFADCNQNGKVSPRVQAILCWNLPDELVACNRGSSKAPPYKFGDVGYQDFKATDVLALKDGKLALDEALARGYRSPEVYKQLAADNDSFKDIEPNARAFAQLDTSTQTVLCASKGYCPNMQDVAAQTILTAEAAQMNGNLTGIKKLGFNPNARDSNDKTPMDVAFTIKGSRQTNAVKALLENGVDPNGSDSNGKLYLRQAAESGNLSTLQALLDAGADPMAIESKSRKAVISYIKVKYPEAFNVIIHHPKAGKRLSK